MVGRRQLVRALSRLIAIQIAIAAMTVALFWKVGGGNFARSALAGAAIAILPGLYMALLMVRVAERGAREIVRAFYLGEVVKFLLTVGLFAYLLRQPDILPIPLFVAFLAVVTGYWFGLLIDGGDR